jgi:hypothetical protein
MSNIESFKGVGRMIPINNINNDKNEDPKTKEKRRIIGTSFISIIFLSLISNFVSSKIKWLFIFLIIIIIIITLFYLLS